MSKPKNWDTMTIEAQNAWRERKRIYERIPDTFQDLLPAI